MPVFDSLTQSFQSDASGAAALFTPSAALLRVLLILAGTMAVWALLRMFVARTLDKRWQPHSVEIVQQLLAYGLWGLASLLMLHALDIRLHELSNSPTGVTATRVTFIALMASVLAPLARKGLVGLAGRHWSPQQAVLSRRAVTYAIWGLATTTALSEMGFNLSVLMGTAGIAGFAITYSGQTSLSNIITGLFLIAEQPFVIGDTITVNGVTGEVLSVDLLSVKLRTPDNLYVRMPNESMLRNTVTNISHFPIRRLDIVVGVSYGVDLAKVEQVLFAVAARNPLGLEDPKPVFMLTGYGDSAINVQFSVWGRKESFLDLKNSMHAGIKEAFERSGIDIPFPQRALVAGGGQPALALTLAQPAPQIPATTAPQPPAAAGPDRA